MHFDTGVTSKTDFVMPSGFKPIQVFDAGSLQRPGASYDYELSLDVTTYTVSWAVDPSNGNDLGFYLEEILSGNN
jgi:hypothetical protein